MWLEINFLLQCSLVLLEPDFTSIVVLPSHRLPPLFSIIHQFFFTSKENKNTRRLGSLHSSSSEPAGEFKRQSRCLCLQLAACINICYSRIGSHFRRWLCWMSSLMLKCRIQRGLTLRELITAERKLQQDASVCVCVCVLCLRPFLLLTLKHFIDA